MGRTPRRTPAEFRTAALHSARRPREPDTVVWRVREWRRSGVIDVAAVRQIEIVSF